MRSVKCIFSIVLGLIVGDRICLAASLEVERFQNLYGELLDEYRRGTATINGVSVTVFDFAQMSTNARLRDSLFERTVTAFEQTNPALVGSEAELKAFWMNAYNLAAMLLVVEHYPIQSIRDRKVNLFRYPWAKRVLNSGEGRLSLRGIEQGILLKRFNDPRIVFAINCMTVSCPDLFEEPFNGKEIDRQLDDLMRRFMKNPTKGFRIDAANSTIHVSWIFDKHRDFIDEEMGGLAGVVHRYLDPQTCAWMERFGRAAQIEYFQHDWTLNDVVLSAGGNELNEE